MAVDILSSIHSAYALQISKLIEQNYLCGSDYFAASLDQLFQVNETLKTLNMAFKEMNRGVFPKWASNVIVLSPLLPASLTYIDMGDLWVKKAVIWITQHYGQVTRAINVLGTVTLFFYGRYFVAMAAFTTYAVSYLSEKKYFSDRVNKVIDAAIIIPIDIYFLVYGNFLDRLLSLFEVAARVKRTLGDYQRAEREKSLPASTKLDLQDLNGMSLERVEVDLPHLDIKPPGGIEYPYSYCLKCLNQIKQQFESVNWENHINVLLFDLSKDMHWNDPSVLTESLFKKTQELKKLMGKNLSPKDAQRKKELVDAVKDQAIQFVREGIQIFTHRLQVRSAEVRNEKEVFNQPELIVRQKRNTIINLYDLVREDYISRVEDHYQSISTLLPECEKEMDRADALLRLGIEAADYCGPQFKTVLAETQSSLAKIGKDITLENGILKILYERRVQYIQNVWGLILKYIPHQVVEVLGLNSPHWPNVILTLYGRSLNAETIGSENDIEAKSTVTEGLELFLMPFVLIFQKVFLSSKYTKENILEWIKEEIHSGRIGTGQIQKWFEEKEYLSNDFQKIYNIDEDGYSITLKDETLIYMLVKMGIFAPTY